MTQPLDKETAQAIEVLISNMRPFLTPIRGYSDIVELYLRALKDGETIDITPDQAHYMITIVQDCTEQFTDLLEEWLTQVKAAYREGDKGNV